MIPFFNIPDIFNFPKTIHHGYEVRRDYAAGNRDYRNTTLTSSLEQSLLNLQDIEGRIESRMTKEVVSGVDMTSAGILLLTAQASLSQAAKAVGEATSTSDGMIIHPSYIQAYYALDNARNALGIVVDAIATAEGSTTAL